MKTKKLWSLIALMVLGMIFLTACGQKSANPPKTDGEQPANASSITAFGVVKVGETRNIMLDFPGVVDRVQVKEGQRVKQGDVLMELELSEYQVQLKNKELELNMARTELQKLTTQQKKADNEVAVADQTYQKALTDLAAKVKLREEGAITQGELNEFQRYVHEREKVLDSLKATARTTATQDTSLYRQRIDRLENELNLMKSKLKKDYLQVDQVICNIPEGIVTEIGYHPGDFLMTGRKLLSIMDISTMLVVADVAEEFIREVQLGASVNITPLADPTKTLKGKVTRILEKAIEKKGETIIQVEISLEDYQENLIPGFNVDVEIIK